VTSYEQLDPEAPRGWSPLAVALIATLVLLLGLGGAVFGITVADRNKAAAGQQIEPIPTTTPTPTPTATAQPTVTSTPTSTGTPDTFALPDLAGLDFRAARTKVRELKLGWRLTFEGTGSDASVRATEPAAGTLVKRGDTVKILVKGSAPVATVPNVKGLPCADAAALVVDAGLYPQYPTGRDGVVLSQTPSASDPATLRWNDEVTLSCGRAP
jgi:hypothetical protein